MARGFSDITPETTTAPRNKEAFASAAARRDPGRLPWIWMGGAAAVAVLIAALAIAVGGSSEDPDNGGGPGVAEVRAAHGPTRMVSGVPSGYTRDKEGAASAAVNTVQALTQAGQGRVDMEDVVAARIARDPGAELRKSIDIDSGRTLDDSSVLNTLPAAVTVRSYSDEIAQVTVWWMSVSQASIGPDDPKSVMALWATSDVTVVWENEDWRVKEELNHTGPSPDEAVNPTGDSPLVTPFQAGYYSFYVN